MSKPINKVYMGRASEAWYRLTEEERGQLVTKITEAQVKFGVKTIVYCDSSWSSDQYTYFGVEEYPSIDAIQEYQAYIAEIGWSIYITETMSLLGTSASANN